MLHKDNKYSLDAQGVANDLYVKFTEMAYKAVKEGVSNSVKVFRNDPQQFEYRSAKAVWMNSQIKKLFYNSVFYDDELMKKINHMKSHGVDYYSLGGKALICFKKMDLKSRISGFYTKRFKDLMNGNAIHYSKQMLENLSEMGIHKPLPIYYVGQVLDYRGDLVDVRLVHYNEGGISYEVSLMEIFKPNLFSLNGIESTSEITVVSKRKRNDKSTGS